MTNANLDLDNEPSVYFMMQQQSRDSQKNFLMAAGSLNEKYSDLDRQEDFLWWWN